MNESLTSVLQPEVLTQTVRVVVQILEDVDIFVRSAILLDYRSK